MADEETNEEAGGEKSGKTSGSSQKNPLATILLLLNAIGLGAVAYFQYSAHQREMARPSIHDIVKTELKIQQGDGNEDIEAIEKKESEGILLTLHPFTANLAQGDGPRRYVRLNAVLKFSKDSKEAEFNARKPQIRDTIISILNSKRPEDLLKIEGKSYLKEEIKAAINSFLVDGNVVDVYYVGFQIN